MILLIAFILIVIVFTAAISRNFNLPLIIIALAIGIIFGSDVTGLIYLDDAILVQKLANIALIFVLFAGGFGTKSANLRPVVKPTIILATFGVLLTALVSSVFFYLFTLTPIIGNWTYKQALLVCAIISSTDAAAVFSILRSRAINKTVASITEIESAANDPMAVILTTFIIQLLCGANINHLNAIFLFVWQLCGGVGIGIGIGFIAVFCFRKIRNIDVGYFYIFLIGAILFSYGLADTCKASGMLSVFFTGYIMGNKKLPYKSGIASFTGILAFISNVALFLLLGLLVFPRKFSEIWLYGIVLFLIITLIGRPISVFISTCLTKLKFKEKVFLSWSGIRGAVPIVLATYPAAAELDKGNDIFNIIFFAVTLSLLIQGTTIGKLADWFKLSMKAKKKSTQSMELVTIHDTDYELAEVTIDCDMSGSCKISDLVLPTGTTITMISRNNEIIAPSGKSLIMPGDTVSILVDKAHIDDVTFNILKMFK